MLSALEKCKDNGGKIITVNPLPEAGLMKFVNPQKPVKILTGGTILTDLFLQVQLNGDVALLKAIMIKLFDAEKKAPGTVIDKDFIKENTKGFNAFKKNLLTENINEVIAESGISEPKINEAVELIKNKTKIIICWAMGLTQHVNGVENIREIVNFLLMKGAIGKPGAGTCPVRGHSNVQGDRTMGIWEAPKDSFLDNLKAEFGFEPPRKHGFAVVEAIKAMYEEKGKVFFAMGGNFLSATPDTKYTAKALRNCALTVHVSTKLNRSHLVHGDTALILPCLGRTETDKQEGAEQFVSVENSMGIVHSSRGVLSPASKYLRSEVSIVCDLAAETLGDQSKVKWSSMKNDYDLIRDKIEAVIPGFDSYNKRVRQPEGFYLPNGAREGTFNTKSGKAEFTINELPKNSLKKNEFAMMTIRSHDQYNTTIYGLDDRYRGIYNERRVVLMNKEDMNKMSLRSKDVVDIIENSGIKKRIAPHFLVVEYDIPKSCIATYFPEANVLVPIDHFAKRSKTPASKYIKVKLSKQNKT